MMALTPQWEWARVSLTLMSKAVVEIWLDLHDEMPEGLHKRPEAQPETQSRSSQ